MTVVTAQGITKPFEPPEPYPIFGTRAPALRSFRLTFPAPNDHEIALIQVLAGGDSDDLSPNAENEPARIPDGELAVALQDANPSDEEFGYLVSHSTLTIPGARRFQIRDVGCQGKCVRQLPLPSSHPPLPDPGPPPLLALVGFKMFFTGARDHELDRIGVWFRGNDLHVAFRDINGDDVFGYLVDFLAIPRVGLNVASGIERGTSSGLETIQLPTPFLPSEFVLTGWAFNFRKDDQEILDIGVIRSENNFTVFYADSGGGRAFDWRMEWVHVGPVVATPG